MNVLISLLTLNLVNTCHGQTSKSVLYEKKENSAEPSSASFAIWCANKFAAEVNPGIKFNETQGLCDGLPFQWLYNQVMDNDVTYFVKKHVTTTWNPPILIGGSKSLEFPLPWLLEADKAVDVYIKALVQWSWISITFKGEINGVLQILFQAKFHNTRTVFKSYKASGGWQREVVEWGTTLSTGVTCKVTFLVFTNYIQINVNDVQFYRYNNCYPTTPSEGVFVNSKPAKTANLHKLVFRKKNDIVIQ